MSQEMSTCESCGNIEPTDGFHMGYGQCGHCVQGVDDEFWKPSPYGNAFNNSTEAGDQADNAAEAQALAQTIQAPQDRGSNQNRQPDALEQAIQNHSLAGMPNYTDHPCSNHGGTGEHDENENNVCPDCGSDWAESQREPY